MLNKRFPERRLRHFLLLPVIYFPLPFILLADAAMEIYHRTCFPFYGLPYVPRARYIRVWDRFRLPYLNWWNKIGCAYCGYANGWINYARAIASETEAYWCGIRHREDGKYIPPSHEKDFVPYGDEAEYHHRYDPASKVDQTS